MNARQYRTEYESSFLVHDRHEPVKTKTAAEFADQLHDGTNIFTLVLLTENVRHIMQSKAGADGDELPYHYRTRMSVTGHP